MVPSTHRLGLLAGLLLMPFWCGAEDNVLLLDHVIERVDRLEFYRLADFGPPDHPCNPCQTAQHVKCLESCYSEIPSLSLVCSTRIRGLSIGPFDHEERAQVLGELFRHDTVFFTTSAGEEPLVAPRVTSVAGLADDDYAIDIEGFESGYKNILVRASTAPDQFGVKVGPLIYRIPLSEKVKDGMYRVLRQCPD